MNSFVIKLLADYITYLEKCPALTNIILQIRFKSNLTNFPQGGIEYEK